MPDTYTTVKDYLITHFGFSPEYAEEMAMNLTINDWHTEIMPNEKDRVDLTYLTQRLRGELSTPNRRARRAAKRRG